MSPENTAVTVYSRYASSRFSATRISPEAPLHGYHISARGDQSCSASSPTCPKFQTFSLHNQASTPAPGITPPHSRPIRDICGQTVTSLDNSNSAQKSRTLQTMKIPILAERSCQCGGDVARDENQRFWAIFIGKPWVGVGKDGRNLKWKR